MKHVVITGSTRGIGKGMAENFLKKGWTVTINGRSKDTVKKVVDDMNSVYTRTLCQGCVGNVSSRDDMRTLWNFAVERGKVDVWINNAGIDQSRKMLWELSEGESRQMLDVNLMGVLNGIAVALPAMVKQGFGRIYNMEGFGSNGMTIPGVSIYGATKRSVSYIAKALKKECVGTPVKSGIISPGMVMTDLLKNGLPDDPEEAAKTRKIYNILADRVETVTPWIVNQIADKESLKVVWLTKRKSTWRFMTAPFRMNRF